MKFYVSQGATEATLADGRPMIRGETIELTTQERGDPFNARLIAEVQLISVSQTAKAAEEASQVVASHLNSPSNVEASSGAAEDGSNSEGGTS